MNIKKRTLLSFAAFIMVFAALLLTATFTDLQVSQILTKGALPPGQYLATDTFGVAFECIGSVPMYLILSFSFAIIFWFGIKCVKTGIFSVLLPIAAAVASIVDCEIMVNETLGYVCRHVSAQGDENKSFMVLLSYIAGGIITVLMFGAVQRFSPKDLRHLLPFVFAAVLTVICAQSTVHFAKIPMGRMRYRAMNCDTAKFIGGFDNYTRWYVVNHQKFSDAEMLSIFGTTDACKSFPSGHTCSAGMSYTMIMLIDSLRIKSKKQKLALWIIPIIFTGTVAVSRIVVGAHFFSDVLIGGTTSFLFMLLFRELFICKGSHFKSVFKQK